MARNRKSEKLILAWKILVQEVEKNPLPGNNLDVWEPLDQLVIQGQMSRGTAGQCLTKLEKAGYLTKHTNRTVRLLFVRLSKLENLGEDILGKKEESPPETKSSQSNSENNQGKIAVPVVANTEDTAKSQKNDPENSVASAKKNASGDVLIVYDYENLKYTLEHEGAVLEFHDLITSARQFGNVSRSTAFIPTHTSSDIQDQLRISGFKIEVCPPRKHNGPDTCDQAIEEFIRFCLKYTSIGTFVVISGDGDFIDIMDEIENNGRKCIVFHYNYNHTSKVLLSRTGNVVNLTSIASSKKTTGSQLNYRGEKHINTAQTAVKVGQENQGVNEYNQILSDRRNGTVPLDTNNPRCLFLKAIVSCLKETNIASGDPGHQKSLYELTADVWRKISENFDPAKENECRRAINALWNFGIIASKVQQKNPTTYYVFIPDHALVTFILA